MLEALARCRSFLSSSSNLKAGWLITASLIALYVGAIRPQEIPGGIANSKATGLAEYRAESAGLWRSRNFNSQRASLQEGDADKSVEPRTAALLSIGALSPVSSPEGADRKMVRTAVLDMLVHKPAEAAEKIRSLAERMGGFLVESQIGGGPDPTNGSMTIRVPAARFEEARIEIRKLGVRVESERIEAQDVSRQYVDQEATLRNLRAEEAQYLAILKQAHSVKDTLEVSEQLGDVRGKIEQQQAEFNALSKQIETVAISISMEAESEARVFGLNWRPLYRVKLALREGLEGLADYASTMTGFIFLLPTVLLWLATIVVLCGAGWKILRWAGRKVFGAKVASAASHA